MSHQLEKQKDKAIQLFNQQRRKNNNLNDIPMSFWGAYVNVFSKTGDITGMESVLKLNGMKISVTVEKCPQAEVSIQTDSTATPEIQTASTITPEIQTASTITPETDEPTIDSCSDY